MAIKPYDDPKHRQGFKDWRKGDHVGMLKNLANIDYVPPTDSSESPAENKTAPGLILDQEAVEEKAALIQLLEESYSLDVLTRADLIARVNAVDATLNNASARLEELRKHIENLLD